MKSYKTKLRLNSINSVNQLLARVINSLLDDGITEDKARVINSLCNTLIKGLEKGDIEQRLEFLENELKRRSVS